MKEVWKRVTGGFLKTSVAGLRIWAGAPAMLVGWTTCETTVTGPPSSWLVSELKKPCGEVTVVQVDAGWVIVSGTAEVTTLVIVCGAGPAIVWTAGMIVLRMLKNVAAG